MKLVQPLNLRSLSGAPLDIWNRKVQLVYLDEAGVGDIRKEPNLVIAGVILNADAHWRDLQRHIKAIRRKYLPSEDQDHFIFHAKDIWHGAGYFKREDWPLPVRMKILGDLAEIPRRFRLSVVHAFAEREAVARWFVSRQRQAHYSRERRRIISEYGQYFKVLVTPAPELPASTVANLTYSSVWVNCVEKVDHWMKINAPNEVAMLVAENPGKIQHALRGIHSGYADDEVYHPRAFTTHHIVDTVTFAEKHESILLQLADTCAFIINRQLLEKKHTQEHFDRLSPQLTSPLRSGLGPEARRV